MRAPHGLEVRDQRIQVKRNAGEHQEAAEGYKDDEGVSLCSQLSRSYRDSRNLDGSIVDTIAKFTGTHCAVLFRPELAGFQEAQPLFREPEILT
jgi:hypothetical protein